MLQKTSPHELKILVIGGVGTAGNVLGGTLNALGYPHTMVMHSLTRALASLQTKSYDIFVILHYQEAGNGFDLIRKIRQGKTRAPNDQILILIEPEFYESEPRPSDYDLMELAINVVARMPLTAGMLDNAIKQAFRHQHLGQNNNTGITQKPADEETGLPPGYVNTPFELPVGAFTIGMYLGQNITIHGHVLVPAGSVLTEAHLDVLESLENVLEDREFLVYLKPHT